MILSIDLRKRVIDAVDEGAHIKEVAKTFKISLRVIYQWLHLRKETGSLAPKTGYQKGHSHKITEWELFKEFAAKHHNLTSLKMAVEWEKLTQNKVSDNVIQRALKKIGYTYKKKLFIMLKQANKKEKNF